MDLKLPTYRNEKDTTGLPIQKVGIRGVQAPIQLKHKQGKFIEVIGNFSVYCDLSKNFKGASMSLMQRLLFKSIEGHTSTESLVDITQQLIENSEHEAKSAYAKVKFQYPILTKSPITDNWAPKIYNCVIEVTNIDGKIKKYLTVTIQYIATCFTKGHKVLMANFTYKNIEKVKIGDEVIGLAEGNIRTFTRTKVLKTLKNESNSLVDVTVGGQTIRCTRDHKWLVRCNPTSNLVWQDTNIITSKYVKDLQYQHLNQSNFDRGWLQGVLDGDGWFTDNQIGLASTDKEIIERFDKILKKLKIIPRQHRTNKEKHVVRSVIYKEAEVEKIHFYLQSANTSNSSYRRGYLAGIYDADGSVHQRVGCQPVIYNSSENILLRIESYLSSLRIHYTKSINYKKGAPVTHIHNNKYKHTKDLWVISITDGFKFFTYCPGVLQRKQKVGYTLKNIRNQSQFESVLPIQDNEEVYNLSTETGNYIINGFIVHNCPCSLELAKNLMEMEGKESGGHQQRAFAEVTVEYDEILWIEDLVKEVEGAVKAIPYPIIRKPDEQNICYTARANPLFVEEASRIIGVALNQDEKILDFVVVCNHEESIHASNAVAVIRKGDRLQ